MSTYASILAGSQDSNFYSTGLLLSDRRAGPCEMLCVTLPGSADTDKAMTVCLLFPS